MLVMSTSLSQFTAMYLSIEMPLRFISRLATTCMLLKPQWMIQSGLKRRICDHAPAWSLPGSGCGNNCRSMPSLAAMDFSTPIGSCPKG
jgi:hypothetical protein